MNKKERTFINLWELVRFPPQYSLQIHKYFFLIYEKISQPLNMRKKNCSKLGSLNIKCNKRSHSARNFDWRSLHPHPSTPPPPPQSPICSPHPYALHPKPQKVAPLFMHQKATLPKNSFFLTIVYHLIPPCN